MDNAYVVHQTSKQKNKINWKSAS